MPIRTRAAQTPLHVIHKALSLFISHGGSGHLSLHACCSRERRIARRVDRAETPRGRNVCGSPQREVFLSAPPNGLRAFTESPRTDAKLQPTSNEGMGCEGEGRACSRGRAVVNTTPHGSPSRADPGLVGRGRAKLPRSRRGIFLPAARPARCLVRGAGWAPRTHELHTTQPARLAFRRGRPREPARPLVRRARSPVVPAPRARLSNCRPSSG